MWQVTANQSDTMAVNLAAMGVQAPGLSIMLFATAAARRRAGQQVRWQQVAFAPRAARWPWLLRLSRTHAKQANIS